MNLPLSSIASSASLSASRAWLSLTKNSLRPAIQCDRPADVLGADQHGEYSGYGPVFRPKAPPTSSVMTRNLAFGTPITSPSKSRMARAPCEQTRNR